MNDISIRQIARARHIALQRPEALNAMTADMCSAIERALLTWRDRNDIGLVIIDAESDRAFRSGGDISELYKTGSQGDYAYGQAFWATEYRLNALTPYRFHAGVYDGQGRWNFLPWQPPYCGRN